MPDVNTHLPANPRRTNTNTLDSQIIAASLKHVHRYGWSQESLAAGAKDLGFSPMMHGVVSRGGIEIVEHLRGQLHSEWCAELATEDMAKSAEGMGTTEKLSLACQLRLAKQAPYMSSWPQALALQALPLNASSSIASLALTSDRAWLFAGDQSTDASWYSKRLMLGGVYVAAEVYMLTDYSVEFEDTWDFLSRQLRDVQGAGAQANLAAQQIEVLMQQALQSMKESQKRR